RYSRIDYIFMAQEALPLLHKASIGLIAESDHAPVSVQIQSPLHKPAERHWKLNENMLLNLGDTDPV
ncbi:Hypothetical predicted protein, partial [Pelobates cultripes]